MPIPPKDPIENYEGDADWFDGIDPPDNSLSLTCHVCGEPAEYNVWYKDVKLAVSMFNIAYNVFCHDHVVEELENGRNGYKVACVKLRE